MNTTAFFIKGDFLIIPEGIPDSQIDMGISLDLLKNFSNSEVFTIPAVDSIALSSAATDEQKTITYALISPDDPLPSGWRSLTFRQALSLIIGGVEKDEASLKGMSTYALKPSVCRLFCAIHIAQWRRDYRFCAGCGTKNIDSPTELANLCPSCGRSEYPIITPAVIIIIINDENKALFAHNKNFLPGLYSIIAGFNEAGETLEDTVIREIREEVNIEVKDVKYIASQPWPFPHSLMLGFCARYAGGTIRVDGIEIEDAQWFSKENLPKIPPPGSVSRYLIERWIAGTL